MLVHILKNSNNLKIIELLKKKIIMKKKNNNLNKNNDDNEKDLEEINKFLEQNEISY